MYYVFKCTLVRDAAATLSLKGFTSDEEQQLLCMQTQQAREEPEKPINVTQRTHKLRTRHIASFLWMKTYGRFPWTKSGSCSLYDEDVSNESKPSSQIDQTPYLHAACQSTARDLLLS
jgi:hypothetical protein